MAFKVVILTETVRIKSMLEPNAVDQWGRFNVWIYRSGLDNDKSYVAMSPVPITVYT